MVSARAEPWAYHVQVMAEGDDFLSRLYAMDMWLRQWEIPYRVVTVPRDDGAIRVCFSSEKHARAFETHFGVPRVPSDATATAKAADPTHGPSRLIEVIGN